MTFYEKFVTEGNEMAVEPGRRRNVGWRRPGADKGQRGSAEERGGLIGTATRSQLSNVWWRTGTIVKSAQAEAKRKSRDPWTKNGRLEASHGVVCSSEQMSLHEVRTEQ